LNNTNFDNTIQVVKLQPLSSKRTKESPPYLKMYEKGTIQKKISASFFKRNKGARIILFRSTKGVKEKNIRIRKKYFKHFDNTIQIVILQPFSSKIIINGFPLF